MNHLRNYIAGLGSGGALIASVIVALIALGGVVAVEGLPDSSQPASAEDVLVQKEVPGTNVSVPAPTEPSKRAGSRVRAGKDSKAKPAKGKAGSPNPGFGDGNESLPQPAPPGDVPSEVPSLTPPASAPPTSPPSNPPHHNPPSTPPPPPPPPIPVPVPSGHGPVGGLVGVTNETVQGITGVNPHLPETITPVTNPADDVINGLTGGKGPLAPPLP